MILSVDSLHSQSDYDLKQMEFPQRTLEFSGCTWNVRSGYGGPGPNTFSDSQENVWIDDKGYLHLRILHPNNVWTCAEVYTTHYTQYGLHKFVVSGNIDSLDANVVLGLFVYADDSHEIDIEFARWGVASANKNGWFTVQPSSASNSYGFPFSLSKSVSSHSFNWQETYINFSSYQGVTSPPTVFLALWNYTGTSIPKSSDRLRTHINFWLLQGNAPSDTSNLEVVIREVQQPLPSEVIPPEQQGIKSPGKFDLRPNFPNPFNQSTRMEYEIPYTSHAELKLYDQQGRYVQTLVNKVHSPGMYSIILNGSTLASNIYFCRLLAPGIRLTRKLILVK
jgi:hypothetical protein